MRFLKTTLGMTLCILITQQSLAMASSASPNEVSSLPDGTSCIVKQAEPLCSGDISAIDQNGIDMITVRAICKTAVSLRMTSAQVHLVTLVEDYSSTFSAAAAESGLGVTEAQVIQYAQTISNNELSLYTNCK